MLFNGNRNKPEYIPKIAQNMNDKVVLICEKSNQNLDVVDKSNYILEGIFAVFDKENVNHRVYEWKEYKPHLDYLQEKIKRNKLVGELDHPEKFDISLQNVSHIIEKLWYDEEANVLRGRLKILDTDPNGMNARKLVDAGFPISVSSRAAGTVQENKKVKINRIFSFDLVADGGFGTNAELQRITESLGFDLQQYTKQPDLKLLNETLGLFNDDAIKVYDVTEKYPAFLNEDSDYTIFDYSIVKKDDTKIAEEAIYTKNKSQIMEKDLKDVVSTDDMHKYSLYVKEEVTRLDKSLSEISEKVSSLVQNNDTTKDEKIAALEAEITKLRTDATELSEKMGTVYQWSEEISKDHNWLVGYAEKIAEDHNHLANYTEKIAEDHNHLANYAEKIAEDHNYVSSYVDEKLRPLLENTINYAEMVAEKANMGLNYVEEVVVNELQNTQNYMNDVLTEKLNTLWNYTEYLGEKANEVTSYAEYLGENAATREDLENVIGYSEHLAESIKTIPATAPAVNESKTEPETITKYSNLSEKIDNILHSIKTEKMNESQFLSHLNEEQRVKYDNFTPIQKEMVANTLNSSKTQQETQSLFESFVNPQTPEERWLSSMPEDIKPLWESASPEVRERITRNAQLYNFNNDYAIKHYWMSKVGLLGGQNVPVINENAQVDVSEEQVKSMGYSSDYVKNIMSRLDQ